MDLPTYIREVGDETAARLFSAKPRTVESWRLRTRYPRREKAREIVALTHGAVSWGGIYHDEPRATSERC